MPKPRDTILYNKVKSQIYKKYPKHSAYRSGLLVQKYKKDFKKKYGNKNPYIGKKTKKKVCDDGLMKIGLTNAEK
jgi:hypothetical protein